MRQKFVIKMAFFRYIAGMKAQGSMPDSHHQPLKPPVHWQSQHRGPDVKLPAQGRAGALLSSNFNAQIEIMNKNFCPDQDGLSSIRSVNRYTIKILFFPGK